MFSFFPLEDYSIECQWLSDRISIKEKFDTVASTYIMLFWFKLEQN